jgi:hypothetical protein
MHELNPTQIRLPVQRVLPCDRPLEGRLEVPQKHSSRNSCDGGTDMPSFTAVECSTR